MPFSFLCNPCNLYFLLAFFKFGQSLTILTKTYFTMSVEIITKQDLEVFKQELISALQDLLQVHPTEQKKWLKTNEVRKILKLSPGTLQNLRINGTLPYTKIGGVYFYPHDEIMKLLRENLRNVR